MNPRIAQLLATGKYAGKQAGKAYSKGVDSLQDSLVQLIGGADPFSDSLRGKAARMAGSKEALAALKYGVIPAAAVAAPAINFAENESYANQGMDLLGMGAGAYGMHKGLVGRATAGLPVNRNLATAAVVGAGAAGLAGSDLIQLLVGGGRG